MPRKGWPRAARPGASPSIVSSGKTRWVPAAFVLFSLFALLVGPLLLSARIHWLRESVVEPGDAARGEINDIRHAITSGEAAIRGLLLTTDPRFLVPLRAAYEEERAAFGRLVPLAMEMGPEVARRVAELQARSRRAFEARLVLLDELHGGDFPTDLLTREEERHDRLLRESAAVKAAITDRTEAARAEIRQLRGMETLLTLLLVTLALLSAGVVLRISRSHRLRAKSEGELRAAATSLAEPTEVGEVLRRIAGIAARTARGESSYVERLDRATGDIEVAAAVGDGAPAVGTRVPYPGSLTEAVIDSGSAEVVPDLAGLDRPISPALAASCARCVALVIPLTADGDSEGALVILRPAGSGFDEVEVEQRRALGTMAALALRRTVLLERAQKQHDALERAVESRERLVRGFSHDVKNPLGAADGYAQLLSDGVLGELEPRQKESLDRIRSGIHSALELISNLIQLARAEAGELAVDVEPVDVATVARETALVYSATADAEGLELITELDDDLPRILSDGQRIRQVLGNLLSNAIKYTPDGGTVRLAAESRSGRRAGDPSRWVTLSVQDTGPGIPPEKQNQLFTEFHRLDPDAAPGEGVGLAISDRVAKSLGGEIVVDSEPGRGSTFTLWLPMKSNGGRPG